MPRRSTASNRRKLFGHIANLHTNQITLLGHAATIAGNYDFTNGRRRRGAERGANVDRGTSTWIRDFLSEGCVHTRRDFRYFFRVPRALFEKLHADLVYTYPETWSTLLDAAKRSGIPSQVKILACLRLLGTGCAMDSLHESAGMGAETLRKYFKKFCLHLTQLYGEEYLNRRPAAEQLDRIEERYAQVGFPGCVGALHCCKLLWKNCPTEQKERDGRLGTILVEGWCDRDLFIWHWFADRRRTRNRKSMVSVSPLFADMLRGVYPFRLGRSFQVVEHGAQRDLPYFLTNGNYPDWPMFVKPIIPNLGGDLAERVAYTHMQETTRKESLRAFSVLQMRFAILRRESFLFCKEDVISASNACVILHNVIVRMDMLGGFVKDLVEDNELMDIVTELGDVGSDWEPKVDAVVTPPQMDVQGLRASEECMTSGECFASLRKDLVTATNSWND